ncbi:MAG TPA: hypothetical protein DCY88_30490 [Cyanobacteria bacterium UBA11372]|nr:hypothetical protein [Cyanobacteria bacterium UBA11372]
MTIIHRLSTTAFGTAVVVGTAMFASSVQAASLGLKPIDLRTWTKEGLGGNWEVSSDGTSVLQTLHGLPTFFVSPDEFINKTITGKFKVEPKGNYDNDFIGFVFGYQSPIAVNGDQANNFNFLLFDWRQSPQEGAKEGFSLAKVNGNFNFRLGQPHPNFWVHKESEEFDLLDTDYGKGKGWKDNTEYDFSLLYQTDRIKIDIDGKTIFDVSGEFQPGRFGFYNFSQSHVRYSGFTQADIAPEPPKSVPEPTSGLGLLTFGALGTGALLKRKQQQKVLDSSIS